jgi:aspartyl-tRNA synthetase
MHEYVEEARLKYRFMELNLATMPKRILERYDSDRDIYEFLDQLQRECTKLINERRMERLRSIKI